MEQRLQFNLIDLQNILDLARNIKHCRDTMDAILDHYYGGFYEGSRDVQIMKEYHEDYAPNLAYSEYILDQINRELDKNGFVGVRLENGSGGVRDQTFDHSFILIKAEGMIFRIESYVDLYCSRIVQFPTYKEDLIRLIDSPPGPLRISLWNNLFSSFETQDTDITPLDMELHTRSY